MGNIVGNIGVDCDNDGDFFFDEEPCEPFTDGPLRGKTVSINSKGNSGVAWYVVSDDGEGSIVAVMVGDDRRYIHDASDCTEIDEEQYCGSCGQMGCGWH